MQYAPCSSIVEMVIYGGDIHKWWFYTLTTWGRVNSTKGHGGVGWGTGFSSVIILFLLIFRLHNKKVYVQMSLRKMMNKHLCKDLHRCIRLEVDGKLVDLPPCEGIIILNILRWVFKTPFLKFLCHFLGGILIALQPTKSYSLWIT